MKNSQRYTGHVPRWGILRSLVLMLIRLYRRFIGPSLGSNCRFYPSCSGYALVSFTYLPIFQAFYYTLKRLFSCHPYHSGGVDMPPGLPDKNVMQFLEKNK